MKKMLIAMFLALVVLMGTIGTSLAGGYHFWRDFANYVKESLVSYTATTETWKAYFRYGSNARGVDPDSLYSINYTIAR